jgi:phosphate transport system protein
MTDNAPTGSEGQRGLDVQLGQLRARAGEMGQWALTMVHDGWLAFRNGDLTLAQKVLDRDTELDRLDQEFEKEVVGFILLHQPAGGDLRTAAALLKATTNLDRIGRLGFDVARITLPAEGHDAAELIQLLDAMDQQVEAMVRQTLEALVKGDAQLAMGLFPLDDAVDRMQREATRLVVRELVHDPLLAARLSSFLLVARHLERIGDNSCKLAERTIYAVTGKRRAEYLPRRLYRPDYARDSTVGSGGAGSSTPGAPPARP